MNQAQFQEFSTSIHTNTLDRFLRKTNRQLVVGFFYIMKLLQNTLALKLILDILTFFYSNS